MKRFREKSDFLRCDEAAAALSDMAAGQAGGLAHQGGEKDWTASQMAQMFLTGQDVTAGGASLGGPDKPYRQSLWFNRCISVKARNLARVPIRVSVAEAAGTRAAWGLKRVRGGPVNRRSTCHYKGRDAGSKARPGEILESGELVDLLAKPNPEQRWNAFAEATAINLDVHGRVHWLFDEMVGRRPVTMYVVPGNRSTPAVDRSGRVDRLVGWRFRDSRGAEYPVLLEECITFQIYDPYDPHGSLSPRVPGNLSIISDYNASLYNAAMFHNSCEPGTVLRTDAPFNPELDTQMRTTWAQRHRGPMNARKLAILWGGLQHDSIAQTLQEMVWDKGKQLTREEICAICDTPASVAGFLATPGRSQEFVREELKRFWQDTVGPTLDVYADAIAEEICPRFGGVLEVWFDLEAVPIYQDMRRSQMSTAKEMFALGRPWRDIDEFLDLGMPERPWDEEAFLPISIQTVQQAVEGSVLPPLDETPGGSDQPPVDEESARSTAIALKGLAESIWRAWERSWSPIAKSMAGMLSAHYAAQGRRVITLLRRALGEQISQSGGVATALHTKQGEDIVARILIDVFEDLEERRKFVGRVERISHRASDLGLAQSVAEAGIDPEQAEALVARLRANPAIIEAIQGDAVRISTIVDDATRNRLRTALTEGLEAGEGARHLADRVQAITGQSRARALTTARNAVGQTLSRTRREGRLTPGVFTHEIWIHSRGPGERRPAHVAAEAHYAREPKPIRDAWIINGAELAYPRDPAGPPSEIINCQCLAVGKRPTARHHGVAPAEPGAKPDAGEVIQHLREQLARGFVGEGQVEKTDDADH